jgi:hypothetical protein
MASHASISVVEEKESGKERTEERDSGASPSKGGRHGADLQRWNCCCDGRQARGQGREWNAIKQKEVDYARTWTNFA